MTDMFPPPVLTYPLMRGILHPEEYPVTDEKPTGKKRRSLLGFYIGLGVALFLLVGGWLAWKPLRLNYSLRKLRAVSAASDKRIPLHDKHLYYCLAAAHQGNRAAVHALIDMAEAKVRTYWVKPAGVGPSFPVKSWGTVGICAARMNRDLFFECLDARDDRRCLEVLAAVSTCANSIDLVYGRASVAEGRLTCVKKLRHKFTALSNRGEGDEKPIGKAALEFLQRRFPEEMAACEKDGEVSVLRVLK